VKLDSMGVIQWEKTIGGDNQDNGGWVVPTLDGGYLVAGNSASQWIMGDKTEAPVNGTGGGFDYWVVKLSHDGTPEWDNAIGGTGHDYLTTVAQAPNGDYIVGGYSRSNKSGDKSEDTRYSFYYDMWAVKLNARYNTIAGTFFADLNNNGSRDAGEPAVPNRRITEQNTNRFGFSRPSGNYNVFVFDSGNFVVHPPAVNYYTAVPATHAAHFSGNSQADTANDFALQTSVVVNDLCIDLNPLGTFRGGRNANYMLHYENSGTTVLNPTVIFFPDKKTTFISSSPAASSTTADSIVWALPQLAPFQSGNILITVSVGAAVIGTPIRASSRVEPIVNDVNPACNVAAWDLQVTGPHDPNDIIVNEDTLSVSQLAGSPWLEYMIRFQNTGNDTAFKVKVLNPIDTSKLQLSTLEYISSSHPVSLSWIPQQHNMEFKFDNILLPDSNVNEPGSHGYVRYRIKPKNALSVGSYILNNAAIYFDFEKPVLTQDASTKILLITAVQEAALHREHGIGIFPNPFSGTSVALTFEEPGNYDVSIYDVSGRQCMNFPALIPATVDLSSLPPGIYFLQLKNASRLAMGKFIKQ